MKSKYLSVFIGLLLVVSMFSMVSAISRPLRPDLVGNYKVIDPDFRVPVFGLTITGAEQVAVGEFSNHDFELMVTYFPDKDFTDFTYSWFYGVWAITDKNGDIVEQIANEVDLGNSNKYIGEIKHSFTEGGTYYYVPAMLEVKQEFRGGEWIVLSEEVIEKEVARLYVAGAPGEPGLFGSIGAFFSKVFDWILSWFS